MTEREKLAIAEAAKTYLAEKKISQAKLADLAGINTSYMSNIMKNVFTYEDKRGGKIGIIKDVYFIRLAKTVGYRLKIEYMPMVETPQLFGVIKALLEAKEGSRTRTIIGETGCGKTYAIKKFLSAYPNGTYVVTVSSSDHETDLIRKIERALEKEFFGTISQRLDKINIELSRRYDSGLNPVVIFDESEYLKPATILDAKTIYDNLKDTCGIAFAGTAQFIDRLDKLLRKPGMPQFYDRIVAGIRYLPPIDREYRLFLEEKGYEPGLIECIQKAARSYRGVSDYLVPVLEEADRLGVEPSAELFNTINHLQKK